MRSVDEPRNKGVNFRDQKVPDMHVISECSLHQPQPSYLTVLKHDNALDKIDNP